MKMVTTVLAILGAIVMAISGIAKIVSSSMRSDSVDVYAIGGNEFPGWFFLLVGIAEVAIAVWLLYPPFRDSGGVALFMVMVGALIFNLFLVKDVLPEGATDPTNFWIVNVVIALVGAAIAYMWPRVAPVEANSQGWAYTDGSGYSGDDAVVSADMSTRGVTSQAGTTTKDMSTRGNARGGTNKPVDNLRGKSNKKNKRR